VKLWFGGCMVPWGLVWVASARSNGVRVRAARVRTTSIAFQFLLALGARLLQLVSACTFGSTFLRLLPAVLARVDHALRGDGFRTGAVLHCWHQRTATAAEIVGLVCES
jgi:hypothetical protein